jgi:hypothetical protein
MSEGGFRYQWPGGKRFAFTIFDDPDSQTLEASKAVYGLLEDLGFRTTKGVWPVRGPREPSDYGATCGHPGYLEWATSLRKSGFEIALHNVTSHTSYRDEIVAGLDEFRRQFGCDPKSYAQHYFCNENIYWGDARLTGINRLFYNLITGFQNRNRFVGEIPGRPEFWSDICRQRIKYVRSFAFDEIDTVTACPFMPYHDPDRPDVNYWFASSEGSNVQRFTRTLHESNQDRLEERGGACIMYTHFGHGYYDGKLNPRFVELMTRLAKRDGWFVPVSTLLDYLLEQSDPREHIITPAQRNRLERRWLFHKVRYGSA